ncbi:MAG: hypothetical protein KGJ43_03415 [Acidobacteriota bacterium]|nr:hypothetical protein [Acidobacteriota bacterium]
MSNLRPRKALSIAGAVTSALLIGACGNANERVTKGTYAGEGGVPAPYLDLGQLAYEVQISRELNPAETEDAAYLAGLSPAQAAVAPGEEWFAVFIQVYNSSGQAHAAATDITIGDTQGNVYSPIAPAPTANNLFVYRGGDVPAHSQIPATGTIAALSPTQGAVLLYKIKDESLSNRPINIKIVNPSDPAQSATAELDV